MSIKALNWAWGRPVATAVDRLVLLALADFADDRNRCWPEQSTLASAAMCSADTVQRSIRRLVSAGHIAASKRGKAGGGRTSNLYTLNVVEGDVSRKMRPNVKPQNAVIKSRTAMRQEASIVDSAIPLTPLAPVAKSKTGFQKFAFGSEAGGEVDPKLMARAEGYGLPVANMANRAERNGKNPSAYFQRLCIEEIRTRLPAAPRLDDLVISKALAGNAAAHRQLTIILSLAEGAQA